MTHRKLLAASLLALALTTASACSSSPDAPADGGSTPDATAALDAAQGAPDAEGLPDAGVVQADASEPADAGEVPPDAGAPEVDAGAPEGDAGVSVPLPGFGDVTGACGVLDDGEWLSSSPFFFSATVDFGTATYTTSVLTPDGQRVANTPNAGGSSVDSEAMSADLLVRCELARVLKTETEVVYTVAGSKKTDILVEIDGRKIGVSVTRAYHFPETNPYTTAEATTLLTRKLSDIPVAQMNADPADAWERSILYVLAYSPEAATAMADAWAALDPAVRGDSVVIVTLTNGADAFIY